MFQPSDNLSFRLIGDYSHRDEECCGNLPAGAGLTAAGPQPSSIAGIERLGGIINDDTFSRDVSITPGRDYSSKVNDGGISGELTYDSAAPS